MTLLENWAQLVAFQPHPKTRSLCPSLVQWLAVFLIASTPTGFQHTRSRALPKFGDANR